MLPIGSGLWGLHMALSQGLLAALVADTAREEVRGTAFGVFNFATGITLLIASIIAGALWQAIGPAASGSGNKAVGPGAISRHWAERSFAWSGVTSAMPIHSVASTSSPSSA